MTLILTIFQTYIAVSAFIVGVVIAAMFFYGLGHDYGFDDGVRWAKKDAP